MACNVACGGTLDNSRRIEYNDSVLNGVVHMSSRFAARLRKALLARPGFYVRPHCPACDRPTAVKDFHPTAGMCWRCVDERDHAFDDLNPDGTPKMPPAHDPMRPEDGL